MTPRPSIFRSGVRAALLRLRSSRGRASLVAVLALGFTVGGLSACFDGIGAYGMPCERDSHCGPIAACIDNYCGGEILCADARFVSADRACDGERDCVDGVDEDPERCAGPLTKKLCELANNLDATCETIHGDGSPLCASIADIDDQCEDNTLGDLCASVDALESACELLLGPLDPRCQDFDQFEAVCDGDDGDGDGDGDGDPSGDGDGDGDPSGDGDGDPSGDGDGDPSVLINMDGTYLFALETSLAPNLPLQFATTVSNMTIAADGLSATADFAFQGLTLGPGQTTSPREFIGPPMYYTGITFDMNGDCNIDMGTIIIPAAANPDSNLDITANLQLLGGIVHADAFCGTLAGMLTSPLPVPLNNSNSNFAAIKLADNGSDPATLPLVFPYRCNQVPPPG